MRRRRQSPHLAPCLALSILFALGALTAEPAGAEALGRLFYTPQQRIQLERLKNQPAEAEAAIGNTISVNGIVQRSGGRSVIWINGVPQSEEDAGGLLAARTLAPDSAAVRMPNASKPVRLKVGESINLDGAANARPAQPHADAQAVPAEKPGQRPAAKVDRGSAIR